MNWCDLREAERLFWETAPILQPSKLLTPLVIYEAERSAQWTVNLE